MASLAERARERVESQPLLSLLVAAAREVADDNVPRLAAALSYYTIFALAPLLVIAVSIAGFAFGDEAAQGQLYGNLEGLVGEESALALQEMVEAAYEPRAGALATGLGIAALLFGAAGVFGQLKSAMNTVWEIEERKGKGLWRFVRKRFLSFTMVLGVGFLLLVSLAVSTALAAFGNLLAGALPGGEAFWMVANFVVAFAVVTLLFALLFRFLPDADVAWKDVWVGAAITAVLFTIGKTLIGLYLGRGTIGSAFGSAGAVVVVLVWVYYSAIILFAGAELTQVYANRYGSMVKPDADGRRAPDDAPERPGAPGDAGRAHG